MLIRQRPEVYGGGFTDEHRTTRVNVQRVYRQRGLRANLPALEGHAWAVARDSLKKAGDLPAGANIPEAYGGMELDQTSGVVIAEMVGRGSGFGSTYGRRTSIGLFLILYWAGKN